METGGSEWANKNVIAELLNLSSRRVLELAREHGWRSKPGQKRPGKAIKLREFALLDVGAYKAERDQPTVSAAPVNEAGKLVPVKRPEKKGSAVDLVHLAQAMAVFADAQVKEKAKKAPVGDPSDYLVELPPWRYVSIRVAAKRIGLSEVYLKVLCTARILPSVNDRGKLMVRIGDVELLGASGAVPGDEAVSSAGR